MYQDSNMLASIRKVEAAREENAKLDPRRMTAEEKETLLKKFHPDYRAEQFTELRFGPNQGQKVPLELAELLEGESRILHETFDLTKPDYETDVLIIGGGGAGCSAAIEADNAGAKVMVVTKLRMGDANTMMAEGGIQAADKPNDSPRPALPRRLRRRPFCCAEGSSVQARHGRAGGYSVAVRAWRGV